MLLKMKDEVSLRGWFIIEHFRNGRLIDREIVRNLIVNTGKAVVAGLILTDVSVNDFDYIAIGTGSTAPSASDTTLENETHRQAGTGTRITTTTTNDTAKLETTFNFTSSYSICESGIFNASTGGDMLCRATFTTKNVEDGDSLKVTWKIQVQAGS